jgi:heptaprenyl diphosphate synthase
MKAGRITLVALFTAVALTIFMVEAMIPPVIPVPGVKLGLANVVTLAAIVCLNKRDAGLILFLRILLGSFFGGQMVSLIYSLAGGAAAFAAMCAAYPLLKTQMWAVGVLGAVAHNAGQLLAASFILGSFAVWWYGPVLLLSAILTGTFSGVCVGWLAPKVKKHLMN